MQGEPSKTTLTPLQHAAKRLNEGDPTGALALCDALLADRPSDAYALINRGLALLALDQATEARRSFNRTINEDPTLSTAWDGLGKAFFDLGDPAKAADAFRSAANLMTDPAQPLYHRGMALLAQGRFAEGWAEYDHRVAMPSLKLRRYDAPRWTGNALNGRRLLVTAEQGYGDMIQFLRLLPLAARTGPVLFEAPTELLPIMAPHADGITLRATEDGMTPADAFDCQIHLMSLPGALGIAEENIQNAVPYIAAPAERTAFWRDALAGDGRKIGICWAGRATHPQDMQRSMSSRHLLPLTGIAGLRLFSLQKNMESFPLDPTLRNHLADDFSRIPENFSETAAIIANLDLVITVDTSLAHVAGALGKPVWTMLPFAADWRWMRVRADTPWYPTMRLFRQGETGDWSGVVAAIGETLSEGQS